MKINTILLFVICFAFAVVGIAYVFNDAAAHYGISPTSADATLGVVSGYYNQTQGIYDQVLSPESAPESNNANFIASLKGIWSTLKLFGNLDLISALITDISHTLGVPPFVLYFIMTVIAVLFISLIVSIVTSQKGD